MFIVVQVPVSTQSNDTPRLQISPFRIGSNFYHSGKTFCVPPLFCGGYVVG
jgi:hypothetical protein